MNTMDAFIDVAREIVDKDPRSRALMAQIQAAERPWAKSATYSTAGTIFTRLCSMWWGGCTAK